MLLSSRGKWNYTQKQIIQKLWFLLYIYSVTPHLRQGGRKWEGGIVHPSLRSSWQEKMNERIPNLKSKENRASHHHYHHSSIQLSCLSFVPPLIWWKSGILAFLLFINEEKYNVDLLVLLSIQQLSKRSFGSKVWKVHWSQRTGCERGLPRKSYHFETNRSLQLRSEHGCLCNTTKVPISAYWWVHYAILKQWSLKKEKSKRQAFPLELHQYCISLFSNSKGQKTTI